MENQNLSEKFRKIGFSQNETAVYLALVKLGSSKAGAISKYASMDSSSVYYALRSLMQKGLVSYVIIGKTRWFQCSNPNNIISYLSNKLDLAKDFVPELDKIRRQSKLKENVRLFKGVKGVKTVF